MTATATPKANIDSSALKPGAAVRILPAGTFRAYDGRPAGLAGWLIDSSIAAALPTLKTIGSSDWLIDYEHQSINSGANGKPVPAAGWFKRLEWCEGDGLYMAGITWTDTARAMIAANEYRHISPVFSYNDRTGAVTSIISVALTNNPALTGLTDLAAAHAVLSSQGGGATVDLSGMNENDRATFRHIFGKSLAASGQALPVPPAPVADLSAMTPNERAKYLHVFGPSLAANGQQVLGAQD